MDARSREELWTQWMRAAIRGDSHSYHRLLKDLTPHLRLLTRRGCARFGATANEIEDVVQEALLAIHLKRATWDATRPIGPWLSAIVRNKLIDALRRRNKTVNVNIDDVMETLAAPETSEGDEQLDINRALAKLKEPQRTIVQAISIEGASARAVAEQLRMNEGAVRVTLHRALKSLAARYRDGK